MATTLKGSVPVNDDTGIFQNFYKDTKMASLQLNF